MIPTFRMRVVLLLVLGPGGFGHGLQGEDAHSLFLGFFKDLGTEVRLREKNEIDGEKNGVEIVAIHGGERGFDGMRGESDEADFAFLARGFEGFHRAVGSEDLIEFGHFGEGVELVEVDVVGAQGLEGTFEFLARAVTGAVLGFAGEEAAAAIGLECGGRDDPGRRRNWGRRRNS